MNISLFSISVFFSFFDLEVGIPWDDEFEGEPMLRYSCFFGIKETKHPLRLRPWSNRTNYTIRRKIKSLEGFSFYAKKKKAIIQHFYVIQIKTEYFIKKA